MMKGKHDFAKFVEELMDAAVSGDKMTLRQAVEEKMTAPENGCGERLPRVFQREEDAYWCLRAAVEKRFGLLVEVLLELGVDANYRPAGRPAVAAIAVREDYMDGVALLLKAKADITLPLQAALYHGRQACAKLLLQKGKLLVKTLKEAQRLFRDKVFNEDDIHAMLAYINQPGNGFHKGRIAKLTQWADEIIHPRPARPARSARSIIEPFSEEDEDDYFEYISDGGQLWEKDDKMLYADDLMRQGFRKEAFAQYESLMCDGWGCSQFRARYMLGWCYIGGLGVEADFEKGCEYFRRALDFAENLDHGYHWGMYHVMDQPDSCVWREVQAALEMGSYEIACQFLDICNPLHDEGVGLKWLTTAVEEGDHRAMTDMGERCLASSDEAERHEGLRLLLQAAGEGFYSAQKMLIQKGLDPISRDMQQVEAEVWYKAVADFAPTAKLDILFDIARRSAPQHAEACFRMSKWCQKQMDEMKRWCLLAVEKGCEPAVLCMAHLCRPDDAQDTASAAQYIHWLGRAACHKDLNACLELAECHMQGFCVPAAPAEAVRLYREGAEAGDARAQHKLAWCCLRGVGTPVDKEEAVRWFDAATDGCDDPTLFRKAVLQEDLATMRLLAFLYENGYERFPRISRESRAWQEMARRYEERDSVTS